MSTAESLSTSPSLPRRSLPILVGFFSFSVASVLMFAWWEREQNLAADALREALFFPPKAILTPPTLAGDWALRILFPID